MCQRHDVAKIFFVNDTAPPVIYTLSLHDALPIWQLCRQKPQWTHESRPARSLSSGEPGSAEVLTTWLPSRSEEHTSELQSLRHLVCRLLLEKKKTTHKPIQSNTSTTYTH